MKKSLNIMVTIILLLFCAYQGVHVYLTRTNLNAKDKEYESNVKTELDQWLEEQAKIEEILKENNKNNSDGELAPKPDEEQEIVEEILPIYNNFYDMMMATLKKFRLWGNISSAGNMYANIKGYVGQEVIPITGKFAFNQIKNKFSNRYLNFYGYDIAIPGYFNGGTLDNKYSYNGIDYIAYQFWEKQRFTSEKFMKRYGYDLSGIYYNLDPAYINNVKTFSYDERTKTYRTTFMLDISKQEAYRQLWYGLTYNNYCNLSNITLKEIEITMVVSDQCKIQKMMTQEEVTMGLTYGPLTASGVAKFSMVTEYNYSHSFLQIPVF